MTRSPQSKRHGRRSRRARRLAYMQPAAATRISTRTRAHERGWLVTKAITRFHRREKYWQRMKDRGMERSYRQVQRRQLTRFEVPHFEALWLDVTMMGEGRKTG